MKIQRSISISINITNQTEDSRPFIPLDHLAEPRTRGPVLHNSVQSPFQNPNILLSTTAIIPPHHYHTLGPASHRHHLGPHRPGPHRLNRSGQIHMQTRSIFTTNTHFYHLLFMTTATQRSLVYFSRIWPVLFGL